jgi:DDE superfamily endonuclease
LILYPAVVHFPDINTPLASRILDDGRFYPYFEGCLGAIDGTHIRIHVPNVDQARYRNRKGYLSQNVLAACDFDLNFVYVLPGWEGSAHDGRVLTDAQMNHGFDTPIGKYWLGDAGYGNTQFIMALYRGVRYHLKE